MHIKLLLCISDKQWTGPNGDNVHFVDGEYIQCINCFDYSNYLLQIHTHTHYRKKNKKTKTKSPATKQNTAANQNTAIAPQ